MKVFRNSLSVQPGTTKVNKTGSWKVFKPMIDGEVCIGCGTCDRVCPEGICFPTQKKNSKGRIIYDRDLNYCKGCGLCVVECPVKAIKMVRDTK